MLLLLVWPALAGTPVEVRVAGLTDTSAAQVLVQSGDDVLVSDCNDAGTGTDKAADGIWSCGSLDVSADKVEVALLRDGVLFAAGALSWPVGPRFIVVRAEASGAVASYESSSLPPPLPAARAAGPGAVVLVRLGASPAGPTPILTLSSPAGSTEISCRNDGRFPDASPNDGTFGCSGVLPASEVTLSWRGAEGAGSRFGTVTWDRPGPLHYLTLDGPSGKVLSKEPFGIRIRVPSTLAPTGPGPPAAAEPDANPPARPPIETPEAAPHRVGALVAAAGFGVMCGFLLRRRRSRLPSGLRALPTPSVLPGGPTTFPAVLHGVEPLTLARELLPSLANRGAVVVIGGDAESLRWDRGGPVYLAEQRDRLDIGLAVGLLRREGTVPTVLILGRVVTDPGAAVGDPLNKLVRDLPPSTPLLILLGPDEAPPAGIPRWAVSGPPWIATRLA